MELTRRFGDFTAVDAISFSVSKAEIFGFLGPNGAGKTTTISMLCTLLRPPAGPAPRGGRQRGRAGSRGRETPDRHRLPGHDPGRPPDRGGEPALPRRGLRHEPERHPDADARNARSGWPGRPRR